MKINTLKPGDIVAVGAIAVAVLFAALLTINNYRGKQYLKATAENTSYLYPLSEDSLIDFEGPLGITNVEVRDGKVSVLDSPCPDKICINAKPIEKFNEWNACLPNSLFLLIAGEGELLAEEEYDAVTF